MATTKTTALTGSVIALNAAALGLQLLGQSKAAEGLRTIAAAIDAGGEIDAHMALVAEKLQSGQLPNDADWDDVMARIKSASDELQAAKPSG